MYYHVAVTNEKCKNSEKKFYYPIFELDITEKERVYKIAREYNGGERTRIKGGFISNRQYPEMIIVQSEEKAEAFKENLFIEILKEASIPYDYDRTISYFNQPTVDVIMNEKKDTDDDITLSIFDHVEKETKLKTLLADTNVVKNKRDTEDDITAKVFDLVEKETKLTIETETKLKTLLADTDVVKNKRVFIVHGHDEAIEVKASQLIKDLGLEPVILHEESDKGQTIIEKLERCTDVGFGIILYTPCDHGGEMGSDSMMPRARQNVVFEHGMLIGKLGRGRVCALLKGDIEKPSDISGIIYKTIDDKGMWRIEVAKELDEAGYDVDMNKLLKIKKKM